jgi:hypothetical protein
MDVSCQLHVPAAFSPGKEPAVARSQYRWSQKMNYSSVSHTTHVPVGSIWFSLRFLNYDGWITSHERRNMLKVTGYGNGVAMFECDILTFFWRNETKSREMSGDTASRFESRSEIPWSRRSELLPSPVAPVLSFRTAARLGVLFLVC